jgi:hypothetical protein
MDKFGKRYLEDFPGRAPVNAIDYDALLGRNFVFFGVMAALPPPLRKAVYKNGSYWSAKQALKEETVSGAAVSNYAALYYLPELTSFDSEKNTLTIMVNNLTHDPSFFQYPDYTIESLITDTGPNLFNGNINSQKHYHVNMAAYLLLSRWFESLRENGVYDNTRIIIVSDHDELLVKPLFSGELNAINTFYNPVLLVKDFDSRGNLKTDMTFMTNADVPLIAFNGLVPDPVNPFTGKALVPQKAEGINIYLGGSAYTRDYPGWEALEKTSRFYHVKDSIFEKKNWTPLTKRY